MILTCPECATRYFVDDARIGQSGRQVRCASCGHRWTATPADEPLVLESEPEIGAVASEPALAPHDLPAEELPKVFRQREQTKRKERQAAASGVIWAAVVGGLVVVIAVLILLRQDIAQIWPRTAGVYAAAGLPVNLVGLTIEDEHAQPMLKDGHADLAVSGILRNVRAGAVIPPPLRINLLAPGGRVVASQIADPGGAVIPPGQARRFVVDILDPPVSATDVEIAFVLGAHSRPAAGPPAPPPPAAAPPPATLDLRGAAPAEAQPLPSSSPYALPAAADPSAAHG